LRKAISETIAQFFQFPRHEWFANQRTVPAVTNVHALFPDREAPVLLESCKEFWPVYFLQHAKMDDERFRAFFAGMFWLKMQNGRTSPKIQKIDFPCGDTEGKQRP